MVLKVLAHLVGLDREKESKMAEAKRRGREKPSKIEQRKVKGRSEDHWSKDLR